jgi:hypothetical protein
MKFVLFYHSALRSMRCAIADGFADQRQIMPDDRVL